MNNVAHVRELLERLVESTDSPIYVTCNEIISYLERNPTQRNLTVGGLRAALKKPFSEDNILIQAAFALTAFPFQALEVRYKLYDVSISDVLEELTHSTYMVAISDGAFIDDEGNNISLDELNSRVFPYFINKFQIDAYANPHAMMETK